MSLLRSWWWWGAIAVALAAMTVYLAVLGWLWRQADGTAVLPADCALVLGNLMYKQRDPATGAVVGSLPGPGMRRRLDTAVELYRSGEVRTLVMSGGQAVGHPRSEAEVMRDLALHMGVNPADVRVETQSRSTLENLMYSRPLVADCHSVVAVSDRYHLGRVAFHAQQLGWHNLTTYAAHRSVAPHKELRLLLREALVLIFYAVVPEPLRRLVVDRS